MVVGIEILAVVDDSSYRQFDNMFPGPVIFYVGEFQIHDGISILRGD
jgi:hypothetical protein